MNYCQKCHHLTKSSKCKHCGSKELRAVSDEDYCFLIEREKIWIEVLKERLDSLAIPYECVGKVGVAMSIMAGPYLDNYKIYVPYCYFKQAKHVVDALFSE